MKEEKLKFRGQKIDTETIKIVLVANLSHSILSVTKFSRRPLTASAVINFQKVCTFLRKAD